MRWREDGKEFKRNTLFLSSLGRSLGGGLLCETPQQTATDCNRLQQTAALLSINRTRCNAATHCNTLQHTATHCNTLQHTATHCNTLQHTGASLSIRRPRCNAATHCNTLQYTATHCRIAIDAKDSLQCCHTVQHTATCSAIDCNRLQHTATHRNTLRYDYRHERLAAIPTQRSVAADSTASLLLSPACV